MPLPTCSLGTGLGEGWFLSWPRKDLKGLNWEIILWTTFLECSLYFKSSHELSLFNYFNCPARNVYPYFKDEEIGTSLVVQWLRLCTRNAGGLGLIPGLQPVHPKDQS